MHVLIRADGGPEIGYGHLVRSSVLTGEVLERGGRVTVATTTPEAVRDVCPPETEVRDLATRTEVPRSLLRWIGEEVDVAVVDSYAADLDYQRAIRDQVPLLLVSDDARHPICTDILVNANLYGPGLEYDVRGSPPEWCLGPEYLLLRSEIRELLRSDPPWRPDPERVIVTLGGSDPRNFTPRVVRALDGSELLVDVIVGPGFDSKQVARIESLTNDAATDYRLARDPDDLPERMFRADLAVCPASTTTYELLGLGTPMVSIPQVENQRLIAEELQERNLAEVLPRSADPATIRDAVATYIDDPELRRRRMRSGRSIVDGRGARRVVEQTLSLTDHSGPT